MVHFYEGIASRQRIQIGYVPYCHQKDKMKIVLKEKGRRQRYDRQSGEELLEGWGYDIHYNQ